MELTLDQRDETRQRCLIAAPPSGTGMFGVMDDKHAMLHQFLGALAYRAQKALRDAPANFGEFPVGHGVRTPARLVMHMTSVLG